MPNWDAIRHEWETSEITFKDLSEKHGVKDSTIRSRKNREKWQRNDATQRATKKSSVATKNDDVVTSKKQSASSIGQRRRSGNPDPQNQFTKRNRAAVTHGLFAKYLPEETMDIMASLNERSPIDLIWDQIQIQYAAILRAQRVMWVEDADDHLKEESGYSSSDTGGSTSYKVAYAHERYNSFLSAQSRAMSELRSLIKQYDELLKTDLATEEQRVRIDVLKSKVPSQNTVDMNKQITALADLINNPAPNRVIDDE